MGCEMGLLLNILVLLLLSFGNYYDILRTKTNTDSILYILFLE